MLKNTLMAGVIAIACVPASIALAQPDPGAYLAGRQAAVANDFAQGARFFGLALEADPDDPLLLESALTSFVALGDFEQAEVHAREMLRLRLPSQVADLAINVADAQAGNWEGIFEALESGRSIGPLVDGLTQGWAHMGNGNIRRALGQFDQVIETEGMTNYGVTHKAYALATVGDFEGAAALFEAQPNMRYSRKSAMAHIEILSQLDRNADALALLDGIFGEELDPAMMALRDALVLGEAVPFAAVPTPQAGLAEVYITVAGLMQPDAPDAYTLLFARAATYLDPANTPAILMTAGLLEELGQYDLANVAYAGIARDDPAFASAELGRAEVLRAAGKQDAAVEVLEALSRSYPDMPQVFARKGDMLRQVDRLEDAKAAYSRALDLYDADAGARWIVLYTRAVTNHQLDLWPEAEADFRASLALQPDNPQILNYLGYSLVERGERMDEALTMIETAVAAEPDNGAIVDSLGWVLFQLGDYEQAAEILERAATLEPVDPVINDHLGDAYWAVGRTTEARFQWQRALSFNPEEDDARRIRAKLDRGLDLVLISEGEEPIRLARGND